MSERTKKRKSTADVPEQRSAAGESEGKRRRFPSRLAVVLIAVAAFAFLIYSVVSLVGIQSQINERRAELNEIKGEISVQEIKNEEMSKTYNLNDKERSEYIEQIARDDLDYVKEGERVFVNVSGD